MQVKIYGIPCKVKSPAIRRAIRDVLWQIRQRAPKDFERIRSHVRGFVPLRKREVAGGLCGHCKKKPPAALNKLRRKGSPHHLRKSTIGIALKKTSLTGPW